MAETLRKDNRKHEFMAAALELFYRKGYENTTIKDIIDELGVSKGAFYHYFESKEAIIINIAREFTRRAASLVKEVFERPGLTAADKMNLAFESLNEYKIRESEWRTKFKGAIQNDENLKLQNMIINSMKNEIRGLYAELIETGVKEGVFGDPVDSMDMAEFLLDIGFSLTGALHDLQNSYYDRENEISYEEFLEKLDRKVYFYEVILERMLQVREGKIDLRGPVMKRIKLGE